jgi:hypothetical protein
LGADQAPWLPFHSLDLVEDGSTKLADELKDLTKDGTKIGVEFVRKYNRAAIAGVVSTPPLGSLIFAIVCVGISVFWGC